MKKFIFCLSLSLAAKHLNMEDVCSFAAYHFGHKRTNAWDAQIVERCYVVLKYGAK